MVTEFRRAHHTGVGDMNGQHEMQARWCRMAWIVSSVALVGGLWMIDGSPVVAATTRSASTRGVSYQRFTDRKSVV